ncbi:MAG: tandem-95 repeat protein, partial [Micrococcales bacterium]|nr:tandem-95 repeat protein [Micrococcales bacterium]
PRPPVAEPDSFGVRAGRDVVLPVLLNDHDPNEDVLSIIGSSVTGLDPSFGTIRVANESQQLVIEVAAGASGSATFSYRVTDGTTADGLNSEPASVTVSVVPEDVNNAPIWCGGDPGCLATWPSPDVLPGGTVSVDVMEAWVDPDGDPVYLSDATNGTGVGTVAADPAGTVTYQHPDPNTTTALSVQVDVTVSDSRGASTSQPLFISVTPSPQLSADSFALTGELGLPMSVTLDDRVHGTKGAVSLTAVKTLNGSTATVVPNSSGLSFTFTADQPGSHVVQYTVRDDTGEMSATVRITVLDPAEVRISTPPLTAFVRPNEDASIDVLTAVENPSGRVLLVSDLRPEPASGASLSVDVVAQSLIRVSGTTADGQPGQLGTVRYTVSDGTGDPNATATGELTVILLPSPSAKPPIATDDTVTVRVGSLIDIPVLANDTAPAGALVSIDPSQVVNESDAGLAFATPRVVRYLAPSEPGTYSVAYTIFRLGFPEMTDSARIFITVLPSDTNTAPLPSDLSGRVLSGRAVSIPFDSFGVDPDGDSVVLDRIVTQPAQGSAAISAESNAIVYTSNPGARGQDAFTYQVRDSRGETAVATVRIGILDEASDPSPVTYSDYAQAQAGASNTVVL